jgi:hypothetical protein
MNTGTFGYIDSSGARFKVVDSSSVRVGSLTGVSTTMNTGTFGFVESSGALFNVINSVTANITDNLNVGNILSANNLNVGSTTIDNSGNINVVGTSTFAKGVSFTTNVNISGGEFIEGGLYVNNNIVVGDGDYGNGVTFDTSGTTLNIYGVTQDSSATPFPIEVAVKGELTISDYSGNYPYSLSSTSGSITLDTSNNSVNELTPGVLIPVTSDGKLLININGVNYYIPLINGPA